jgi:hypothetical protein
MLHLEQLGELLLGGTASVAATHKLSVTKRKMPRIFSTLALDGCKKGADGLACLAWKGEDMANATNDLRSHNSPRN